MPGQKKRETRFERDSVGWSLLRGVVETHACLPVLDQTESYIGKGKLVFFNTVHLLLELQNGPEKYLYVM